MREQTLTTGREGIHLTFALSACTRLRGLLVLATMKHDCPRLHALVALEQLMPVGASSVLDEQVLCGAVAGDAFIFYYVLYL